MTFSWSSFLDLAKQLSTGDEASCRSSISRAYYALFCSARDRLIESNIQVSNTADAHMEVKEIYALSNDFECQKIITILERVRVMRNNADYDLKFDGDPATSCSKAVERVDKALQMVNNIPDNVIDEIKTKI